MGQPGDEAGATPKVDVMPPGEAGGLRQAAVAIDPPPRGSLGIRDLLELLEKEVGRDFRADAGTPSGTATRTPSPVRKQS
jgi:hypothetical protein